MKKYLLLFFLFPLLFTACSNKTQMEQLKKENTRLKQELNKARTDLKEYEESARRLEFLAEKLKGIKARIVTDYGNIELEFFPEKAPIHCFSFITRAESGYYKGTQFHRVIPGFMIQGGDPNSKDGDPNDDGMGGPIAMIPHEFNDIHHTPGILSMARTSNINAGAGSQFFIMDGSSPNLDGQYTAFGKVTSGMDVVKKIATAKTYGATNRAQQNHPVKPVRIRKIEVYR